MQCVGALSFVHIKKHVSNHLWNLFQNSIHYWIHHSRHAPLAIESLICKENFITTEMWKMTRRCYSNEKIIPTAKTTSSQNCIIHPTPQTNRSQKWNNFHVNANSALSLPSHLYRTPNLRPTFSKSFPPPAWPKVDALIQKAYWKEKFCKGTSKITRRTLYPHIYLVMAVCR